MKILTTKRWHEGEGKLEYEQITNLGQKLNFKNCIEKKKKMYQFSNSEYICRHSVTFKFLRIENSNTCEA